MSYDHWKTTNPDDEFLGPDPEDHNEPEPTIMKAFKQINGRLVSVTTEHVHPPIPSRRWDYCARFSNDEREQPDYGWGVSAEDAIDDLIRGYDYEDTLPSFAELYGVDLLYARLHWQEIERSYQEVS